MKTLIPLSVALVVAIGVLLLAPHCSHSHAEAAPLMSKKEMHAWRCFTMKGFCKRQVKRCYIPEEKEKTYDLHSFIEQKPWMDKLDKHICSEILTACKQILKECSKDKEDKE